MDPYNLGTILISCGCVTAVFVVAGFLILLTRRP